MGNTDLNNGFIRQKHPDEVLVSYYQASLVCDYIGRKVSATAGGVYIGGYTDGTLPGQTNSGAIGAFLRKYDANGIEIDY